MSALRVAVLVSGTGSLLRAILEGQDRYEVVLVLSDRPGVEALERAERAGVPGVVVDWTGFGTQRRADFSAEVGRAIAERRAGLVCQAGFMRILAQEYFDAHGVPVMNSHPALLPAFSGAHGVRDALAYGAKVTGATIHFATLDVDHGPVIAQEAVEVRPDDSEEALHERIKAVEQRLYVEAIRLFAQGRLKVEGGRVHVLPAG